MTTIERSARAAARSPSISTASSPSPPTTRAAITSGDAGQGEVGIGDPPRAAVDPAVARSAARRSLPAAAQLQESARRPRAGCRITRSALGSEDGGQVSAIVLEPVEAAAPSGPARASAAPGHGRARSARRRWPRQAGRARAGGRCRRSRGRAGAWSGRRWGAADRAGQVREAQRAEQQLAHDQQRPALADPIERAGEAARLAVFRVRASGPSRNSLTLIFKVIYFEFWYSRRRMTRIADLTWKHPKLVLAASPSSPSSRSPSAATSSST